MCGFFISNDPIITSNHQEIIEKCLRFRGPDGSSGLHSFENGWSAYHSRLSIIDLHSGVNQPVIDNKGGVMVFNGEILNYVELGQKYFNKDYSSDTQLLNDLIFHGKLELAELDGFFAIVYIDSKGQLQLAARDAFGVKPLFFIEREGFLSLSSEPNVLKELFDCKVDELAIQEYLSVRAPIFSGSYFKNVNNVKPGNCLVTGEYFNCSHLLKGDYEDPNLKNIEAAIQKGIDSRVVSDAPVGLLLSRGIDSHLLKSLSEIDKLYSIGFEGDGDYEYLKTKGYNNLTLICSTPESYKSDFDYLLSLRQEPMSVPNEVLLYQVSKVAAADGIKVLLSGEGADEFFGGYDRVFQWASNTEHFDLKEFIKLYCYTPPREGTHVYSSFEMIFKECNLITTFEKVRWFFIRYHMPVLFRRLDFALMAAGVEGREPLANMHTFLAACTISPDDLMGEKLGKVPLRDIIMPFMGHEFAFENKIGFPVDLTKIFDNPNNHNSYDLWFEKNLEVLK